MWQSEAPLSPGLAPRPLRWAFRGGFKTRQVTHHEQPSKALRRRWSGDVAIRSASEAGQRRRPALRTGTGMAVVKRSPKPKNRP